MAAVVVAQGSGRFVPVGSAGAGVTIKASEPETGGLCTVWEGHVPPGTVGAGPHFHRERDEFFYVLEGELMLRVGDETHSAGAGTFAFIPRQTVHGFHNAGRDRATLLVMHHPAGFERFFEEMQQLAARQGSLEEREALAARFDVIPAPTPAGSPIRGAPFTRGPVMPTLGPTCGVRRSATPSSAASSDAGPRTTRS